MADSIDDQSVVVAYGQEIDASFRRIFRVTTAPGPHGKPGASAEFREQRFKVQYSLTRFGKLLQLRMGFRDHEPGDRLGRGWGIFTVGRDPWLSGINLLQPVIEFAESTDGADAICGAQLARLVPHSESSCWEYHSPHIPSLVVVLQRFEADMLLPIEIQMDGWAVNVSYHYDSSATINDVLLNQISWQREKLEVVWNQETMTSVDALVLRSWKNEIKQKWSFEHRVESGIGHLMKVSVENGAGTFSGQRLNCWRFDYRNEPESNHAKNDGSLESIWQEVTTLPPNMRLPRDFRLRDHPGLSFQHLLHQRRHPDVIDTSRCIDPAQPTEFPVWSWMEDEQRWEPRHQDYFLPRPFYFVGHKRIPSGAQFSSLAIEFPHEEIRNTNSFPSIIASSYQPADDPLSDASEPKFQYSGKTYFPNVFGMEHQRGWVELNEHDQRALRLPVPLQFESSRWPIDRPGLKRAEGGPFNQAVQLVTDPSDGHLLLFYSGLLFIDHRTGDPLLAPHRASLGQNRRFRYRERWDGIRDVDHYLCQAVWRSQKAGAWEAGSGEPEGGPSSYWERVDLGTTVDKSEPNGAWVLPWHDASDGKDPAFHYHYQAFRNVQFILFGGLLHAVVRGVGVNRPERPDAHRPIARHLYRLRPLGKRKAVWEFVAPGNRRYLPEAFWGRQRAILMDIDGDGDDEIIIPRLGTRGTVYDYSITRGWRERPSYRLPQGISPHSSSVRFWSMDAGNQIEIYQDRGPNRSPRVFLNQAKERSSQFVKMTKYTNEDGELSDVE